MNLPMPQADRRRSDAYARAIDESAVFAPLIPGFAEKRLHRLLDRWCDQVNAELRPRPQTAKAPYVHHETRRRRLR